MKTTCTTLVTLIIAILISGCAGNKVYKSKDGYSKAQNVIHAAGGYKRFDMVVSVDTTESQLVEAALFGKVFSGTGATLTGSLLSGGLAMGAADLLTNVKDTESFSGIIAWMPKEMAGAQEEAAQLMTSILEKATDDAVTATTLPLGYGFGEKIVRNKTQFIYPITGELCENDARCQYTVSGNENSSETLAPNFLGGSPSWAWGLWYESGLRKLKGFNYKPRGSTGGASYVTKKKDAKFYEVDAFYTAVFPDLEFYMKVSENLPEWFFIYLAPPSVSTRVSYFNEGRYDFIKVPLILNQGKVYPFIKPKA